MAPHSQFLILSFHPSYLIAFGRRAMKKLVTSARRLSLKSKASKAEAKSPVSPQPSRRRHPLTDLRGPGAKCYRRRTSGRRRPAVAVEEKPPVEPAKGWSTTKGWDPEAAKVAVAFMDHYASIGLDGIKEEFRREIQRYSSSEFGDTAFKANKDKNRDNDIMACLDGARVELVDGRYINASWVFDKKRLGRRKYILTQEPMRATTNDFWEMCYEHGVSCIIVLSEKEEGWPPKADPADAMSKVLDKFWPIVKTDSIVCEGIVIRNVDDPNFEQWKEGPLLETRRLNCTDTTHVHDDKDPKAGCIKTRQETFLAHIAKSKWSQSKLMQIIHDIAVLESRDRAKGIQLGPIVLIDDYSATSRAAVLAAVDIVGQLMYKGEKHVTVPGVAKWMRCCRHYSIRNEDDYVLIVKTIFSEMIYKYDRTGDYKETFKQEEKYRKMYDELFGKKEKEAKGEKK